MRSQNFMPLVLELWFLCLISILQFSKISVDLTLHLPVNEIIFHWFLLQYYNAKKDILNSTYPLYRYMPSLPEQCMQSLDWSVFV